MMSFHRKSMFTWVRETTQKDSAEQEDPQVEDQADEEDSMGSRVTTSQSAASRALPERSPAMLEQAMRQREAAGGPDVQYELQEYGYGKNYIKLLKVERQGKLHTIREYEVNTHLQLDSREDYLQGVNKHIIATDTQKNTVYVLARRFGIKSPEDFCLLLCSHFLYLYPQVTEVSVHIEEFPWQRVKRGEKDHNHAFVFSPVAYRSTTVSQRRNEAPCIQGELHGLRLLKTTQSSFKDFVQDEFRTLPDVNDRVFSTEVSASWLYNSPRVDFDRVWKTVKECILEQFAGDPEDGIASPSVQNTLYLAAKMVLDRVDEIDRVVMEMPNKHYNTLDLSKFANTIKGGSADEEVYQPVDKPAGIIHAQVQRCKSTLSRPRGFHRRAKL